MNIYMDNLLSYFIFKTILFRKLILFLSLFATFKDLGLNIA